jgi:hypothetical protein
MYEDYDDEQFLGPESIVALPEDAFDEEGGLEQAFETMEALEHNPWARHAWRANARAHELLLQDSASEDELRRCDALSHMLQLRWQ